MSWIVGQHVEDLAARLPSNLANRLGVLAVAVDRDDAREADHRVRIRGGSVGDQRAEQAGIGLPPAVVETELVVAILKDRVALAAVDIDDNNGAAIAGKRGQITGRTTVQGQRDVRHIRTRAEEMRKIRGGSGRRRVRAAGGQQCAREDGAKYQGFAPPRLAARNSALWRSMSARASLLSSW